MSDFIAPTIESDPAALAGLAFAYLESAIPGWTPAPGNLDVLLIEAIAQIAAEQAEVASGVPTSIFRYFGPVVGVPPLEASPAAATATLSFVDATAHHIDSGSVIGLRDPDGALWTFETVADIDVVGVTSTAAIVTATEEGTGGNGLSGVADLVDMPAFVQGAALVAPSSGGTDAEDDAVYLDRLAETLSLLSPRPILPNDFAVLSRSIPGVFRAAAIDGLKPGPPYDLAAEATGQARTITIAVATTTGAVVGGTIRAAVAALLQSEREVNFAVFVVDPIYAVIDLTFTVKCWPGYAPADVQSRAITAAQAWLSAGTWGQGQDLDPTTWLDDRVVRIGEVYEILNAVEGVRYVQGAPTIGLNGGGQAAADLAIGTGTAIPVLTTPGAILGTAVA